MLGDRLIRSSATIAPQKDHSRVLVGNAGPGGLHPNSRTSCGRSRLPELFSSPGPPYRAAARKHAGCRRFDCAEAHRRRQLRSREMTPRPRSVAPQAPADDSPCLVPNSPARTRLRSLERPSGSSPRSYRRTAQLPLRLDDAAGHYLEKPVDLIAIQTLTCQDLSRKKGRTG